MKPDHFFQYFLRNGRASTPMLPRNAAYQPPYFPYRTPHFNFCTFLRNDAFQFLHFPPERRVSASALSSGTTRFSFCIFLWNDAFQLLHFPLECSIPTAIFPYRGCLPQQKTASSFFLLHQRFTGHRAARFSARTSA